MSKAIAALYLGLLFITFPAIAASEPSQQWTPENVVGLALNLDDPIVVEEFRFAENGIVMATIGQKGGALAAPLLTWQVVDGVLQISNGEMHRQFTLLYRDNNTVRVKDHSGKVLKYIVMP